MARTAVSPGVDEPPPPSAASSERDAARELAAPMDHNQQEGSVSRQTDHVECPDRSTSTTYVDYSGGSYGDEAGAASTVSTASGGGDSHRLGADSMVASSSEENKREVRTASSAAHGRSGKEGGCSGSSSRPYIPLHGFVSFICDLHMKTPQEILEKVKTHPYTCTPAHTFLNVKSGVPAKVRPPMSHIHSPAMQGGEGPCGLRHI